MIASQLIRDKLQPQMGDVLPYVQMFRVLEEIFQNLDDKIHCASCDEVFDLKNFLAFWQVRMVSVINQRTIKFKHKTKCAAKCSISTDTTENGQETNGKAVFLKREKT